MRRFRFFILGAGFSSPAGLPLAHQLWEEVLSRARQLNWMNDMLDFELQAYERFRVSRGNNLDDSPFDFEDFFAYLDLEHALGLKGSDHFSDEGNRLQLALKWLIAQVLVERTPAASELPSCYLEFARLLQPHDYVLTFNYDTVLERALDAVGKPYRLFPSRYQEIRESHSVVDNSREEVAVIKLHGSVDWFDKSSYLSQCERYREQGIEQPPDHIVFGPRSPVETSQLMGGPQFPDDPLTTVHRVSAGLEELYRREPPILVCPFLLAPSNMKVLYANKMRYFYWGLGQSGGMNLGITVIGYSLPRHDDYARRFMMDMFRNYQNMYWGEEMHRGMKKTPVLLIDFRNDDGRRKEYERIYSFSDTEKTEFYYDGFGIKAVEYIRGMN